MHLLFVYCYLISLLPLSFVKHTSGRVIAHDGNPRDKWKSLGCSMSAGESGALLLKMGLSSPRSLHRTVSMR